jgi:hypothetical protein
MKVKEASSSVMRADADISRLKLPAEMHRLTLNQVFCSKKSLILGQ